MPSIYHPTHDPSTLRALFDCDVELYDCGIWCGMADARRAPADRRAYDVCREIVVGTRDSQISRAYAEGYRAGFAAVVYGVIR
jgi:hypothetical protein